ncbi:two-component system sensor histidine kinase ResE [Geomicrobium halophilum]|uniref:histidine kinase n=1 Tax=Geomicrobium halophilum TaxID=549000 RepID=A0A841PJE7_9BACL|nr:ATP-binding protein [Geomicrobium halophilum]MBB6448997.1 two-component system sensor histidine kinase ResE [Geomicrobium halophilum]
MIWRSVVGKLWLTILLLVSCVLLILTVLLFQFFENMHLSQIEDELGNHASYIVSILEGEESLDGMETVRQLTETSGTHATIFRGDVPYWTSFQGAVEEEVYIPPMQLAQYEELSLAIRGEESVITQLSYEDRNQNEAEFIVVAAPFEMADGMNYTLLLYQSLAAMEETTQETKRLIFLAAGIGFIMTTFFAFFLSSRITAPLRKMRQSALEVAKGNFDTPVPMMTRDEIGQLAIAFNRMRRQLNNNIEALNREKEQLARVLSSMADGVITLNRMGDLLVSNPPADRFLRSYGYEHQGTELGDWIPEEIQELFRTVVAHEQEETAEVTVQGRSYVVLMSPLYDASFVRGVVAVIRDMTEERQNDKLRKDFIANVSHELRTPISMLQGYSEAMIDDVAQSREEEREMSQIIYDESLRMGRLVNELLDMARMETGQLPMQFESIDLFALSEKVFRKFKQMGEEINVNLNYETFGSNPWVEADADRIEQVLTNLMHNALRHTSNGGSVTLHVIDVKEGIKIEVKDTGSGIPEEDLPFVFERFYKADKARTRGQNNGGTGLGLAIAKNIVENHDGEISVQSIVDRGSTFMFFLYRKS